MFMMDQYTVILLLVITYESDCSVQKSNAIYKNSDLTKPHSDKIYTNRNSIIRNSDLTNQDSDSIYLKSISSLISPSLCQLKLICAISKSGNSHLKNSTFMHGISVLASYRGEHSVSQLLEQAVRTGETGRSCRSVAPDCHHSGRELLLATQDLGLTAKSKRSRVRRQAYRRQQPWSTYNPFRRQGFSLSRMPPVFRPDLAGRRQVCRSCDQRSTVCTVYSVGTYAGCTGVWLVAGLPGQLACNLATAPGSLGCGMNTLHCYMSGCGLINLPRLSSRLSH